MWKRHDGHAALQEHLIALYSPFYRTNDRAHQIPHVVSVSELAVEINQGLGLGLDNEILVGAAMAHDLFNHSRDNHHELAKEYLLTNPIAWLREFNEDDRILMACAAGEHRASYKGEYTSVYSQVVAGADRGTPNATICIVRCAVFGADKHAYRGDELYDHVIRHMKEKFGVGGYARYPKIYQDYFEEQLRDFAETMENLTREKIGDLIDSYRVISR